MPPYRRIRPQNEKSNKERFVKTEPVKMARGEGEIDSGNNGLMSHFVKRVVKLPMIHVAWDYASDTYSSIKESNRLVNFTLTNAERSVNFLAGQAMPVVKKFEKQIQVVDDLACKGLGTLEEKVPLITKRPDQIIGDTKQLYSSTIYSRLEDIRNYGRNKVKSVTDYGLQKASIVLDNPFMTSMIKSVDGVLLITEHYIDYILPPTEDEKSHNNDISKHEGEDKKHNPLARLTKIPTTIRRRTYHTIIVRTQNLRTQAADLMNIPSALVAVGVEIIENANTYIMDLWLVLSSDDPDTKKVPEKFPLKQLVPVTRPIVKQLINTYGILRARLNFIFGKKSESNDVGNNTNHVSSVGSNVRDDISWVIELIRSSPKSVRSHIYSWISSFVFRPTTTDKKIEREENNCVKDHKEQNHVHENNVD